MEGEFIKTMDFSGGARVVDVVYTVCRLFFERVYCFNGRRSQTE